jgi:hypothetical protein
MFDLHVLDFALAPCNDFDDHQVKAISTARGFWTPTKLGLRSSTRSVPMSRLLLAPTFVEGYFTVIFSSVLSPLSTPIRCLSLCSASIALQLATLNPTSTLPHQYRRCLNRCRSHRAALVTPPSACCATSSHVFPGFQLKRIYALRTVSGERILCLCLLPSLRLRTYTLTSIY